MPPSPVRVSLKILGETVSVEVPQPPAQARLEDLLPLLTALDDAVVEVAIRAVEKAGEVVSCCKGCSACCRAQPVPITPPEAFRLARYVEAQPEPRKGELKAKFANRVERLRDAGLLEGFRDGAESPEQARRLATDYFRLGLICPFLDETEGACGIYEIRPFVCRQYLVTSDPALCADPLGLPVKRVPMPIAAAGATLTIAEQELGRDQRSLPLVLALEYTEAHRDDSERRFDSARLAPHWVAALAK